MEIILMRHATAQGNPEHRFIGVTDAPLLPEGRILAEKTAQHLPSVSWVYTSPLIRCIESASIFWPCTPQTHLTQLMEMNFGMFEGKTHQELEHCESYQTWLQAPEQAGTAETAKAVTTRMLQAFHFILEDARKKEFSPIGVVSHGGAIMLLLSQMIPAASANIYQYSLPNCGGYRIHIKNNPFGFDIIQKLGNGDALL